MSDSWARYRAAVARTEQHFIGGRWLDALGSERAVVRSPHDGAVLIDLALAGPEDIDRAVTAARAAFVHWAETGAEDRAALVRSLAERYGASLDELARMISSENGSPISFSHLGQVGAVPLLFDGFLRAGARSPWEGGSRCALGRPV